MPFVRHFLRAMDFEDAAGRETWPGAFIPRKAPVRVLYKGSTRALQHAIASTPRRSCSRNSRNSLDKGHSVLPPCSTFTARTGIGGLGSVGYEVVRRSVDSDSVFATSGLRDQGLWVLQDYNLCRRFT